MEFKVVDPHGVQWEATVPEDVYEQGPDDHNIDTFHTYDGKTKDAHWKQWLSTNGGELVSLARDRRMARATSSTATAARWERSAYQPLESKLFKAEIRYDTSLDPIGTAENGVPQTDSASLQAELEAEGQIPLTSVNSSQVAHQHASANAFASAENTNSNSGNNNQNNNQNNNPPVVNNNPPAGGGNPPVINSQYVQLPQTRCCDALKLPDSNLARGAIVLLGLAALGAIIGAPVATYAVSPDDVTATATWKTGGADVVVSWSFPTPNALRTVTVSLTNATGGITKQAVSGLATAVTFLTVPAGSYTVTVQLTSDGLLGPAASTHLAVTDTGTTVPTTPPNPPTGVTVAAVVTDTGLNALKASWTAPATGSEVRTYTITWSNGTTSKTPLPVMTTSVLTTELESGSWVASVTADNSAGSSAAVTSSPPVAFTKSVIAAPGAPRNVRLIPYRSATARAGGVLVRWDAPVPKAGEAYGTLSYKVELTGGPAVNSVETMGRTFATFADIVTATATTLTAKVTVRNETGSNSASASATVSDATVPADTVDWNSFFDPDEIDAWRKAAQPTPMTDAALWASVLDAIADTSNTHGGVASYPEQLLLARTVAAWLPTPAAPPRFDQLEALATRLAGSLTPPFPTKPPTPGSTYADPLALWKAAQNLTNTVGAAIPTRHKFLVIAKALERYLAQTNDHVALYDFSTVPTDAYTNPPPDYAIETAQRYQFLTAGKVTGVWWYRMAGDTGQNTVTAWQVTKGGTPDTVVKAAEASGDADVKTGWAYLEFTTPVTVAKDDVYLFGVYHPNGVAARRLNAFTNGEIRTNFLLCPQSTPTSRNGLYEYPYLLTPKLSTATLPDKEYQQTEHYISPAFVPA